MGNASGTGAPANGQGRGSRLVEAWLGSAGVARSRLRAGARCGCARGWWEERAWEDFLFLNTFLINILIKTCPGLNLWENNLLTVPTFLIGQMTIAASHVLARQGFQRGIPFGVVPRGPSTCPRYRAACNGAAILTRQPARHGKGDLPDATRLSSSSLSSFFLTQWSPSFLSSGGPDPQAPKSAPILVIWGGIWPPIHRGSY